MHKESKKILTGDKPVLGHAIKKANKPVGLFLAEQTCVWEENRSTGSYCFPSAVLPAGSTWHSHF